MVGSQPSLLSVSADSFKGMPPYKIPYISSSELHNSQGQQLILLGGFHNFVYYYFTYVIFIFAETIMKTKHENGWITECIYMLKLNPNYAVLSLSTLGVL